MPKKEHDNFAAKVSRPVDYDKCWYRHGLEILKKLNKKNFRVLDLGCGNGEFSELLKQNFEANVTCLDYAESHLERVRRLGFDTVKCDFDSIDDITNLNDKFKNSFDVICSFEVIEHVFDVDTYLSTIHNLLKDNGCLIISTPNISYFGCRIYSHFRGNLPVSEGHHIRFFSHRRLEQYLILNSFNILDDYSFGQTEYYLDRASGEGRFRSFYINWLFNLWRLILPKSSPSYNSSILYLAQKTGLPPIGLDPGFRKSAYDKLASEQKRNIINKLLPLRRNLFFDECPGLRKFIDEEAGKF